MNEDDRMNYMPVRDDNDAEPSAVSADDTAEDPAAIRARIEQTRAEMGNTIEQIQARLNPEHIKEQVMEQVWDQYEDAKETVREATIGRVEDMVYRAGETVSDARQSVMGTIRDNPIPAALVGLGLGWMYMNRRTTPTYEARLPRRSAGYREGGTRGARYYADTEYYGAPSRAQSARASRGYTDTAPYRFEGRVDQYSEHDEPGMLGRAQEAAGDLAGRAQAAAGDLAGRAQAAAGDLADRAQESLGSAYESAQETAGNLADGAMRRASRFEEQIEDAMTEQPLLVGALVLGIGAAIGLSMPRTRKEDQLMGEVRDNLVERAHGVAQGAMDQVQRVASDVAQPAGTASSAGATSARPGGMPSTAVGSTTPGAGSSLSTATTTPGMKAADSGMTPKPDAFDGRKI